MKGLGGWTGLRRGKGASAARKSNFNITKAQYNYNYICITVVLKSSYGLSVEMVLY